MGDALANPALVQVQVQVQVYGMAHQMLKTRARYYDALNRA